jgi:hypothetical protein
MAHDLIHMIVTALLCRLQQDRIALRRPSVFGTCSECASEDGGGNGPEVWGYRSHCRHWATWHKTKRPGLGLSQKALSRSALPRVLLNHRIKPQLFRVNGTEVPDDITLRPYRYSPPRLNLYPLAAGHFRER